MLENFAGLDENRIKNLLTTIKNSSEKAFELLENLLVWANAQTGQIVFSPQPVNLRSLIEESISLMDGPASNKGIRIAIAMKDDPMAFGDQHMIRTVLRNLISNAVKYTPFGGEIVVSVSLDDDQVKISIRDSGIGIPKEDIQKLFRIESKYSTRGTADEKGTGLGLILCKEFIDKHGGKIWVESEEGKGSTFSFTVPVGR
ncbi:MAG: HAMP domain-containing sensor histidine kinase [Bacteroidota bacterium]